jgi:hypothetical protein
MILGVISFSFANGSFASIINNYDESQQILEMRVDTLSSIRDETNLP